MARVLFLLIFLCYLETKGQCSATASNGDYTVSLTLVPSRIIPSSTSCSFGFNYNIEVGYEISITGTNVPSGGLWTSQGNLTCNNGTNGNQTLFVDLANGITGPSGLLATSSSNPYSSRNDCATATPKTYNCSSFSFEVQGPNLSQTVTCPVTPAAFPLKLVDFKGKNEIGKNYLNWSITDAYNFEYFQVQKSYDARSFETVSPKIYLDNQTEFLWNERSNKNKKETYYRLVMNDFDGNTEFSKIIVVENFDQNLPVVLYPVPTSKELNILWDDTVFNAEKFEIYDIKGVKILERGNSQKIELNNFTEGTYILKMKDSFEREISKQFYIIK